MHTHTVISPSSYYNFVTQFCWKVWYERTIKDSTLCLPRGIHTHDSRMAFLLSIYRLWLSTTDCCFQRARSWLILSIVFTRRKEPMQQSSVLSECKMKVARSFFNLLFGSCSNVRHLFRLQVAAIFKTFLGSFSWSMFQWFYSGGDNCGFQAFPMFGLEVYKRNRWENCSRICLTNVYLWYWYQDHKKKPFLCSQYSLSGAGN